MKFLVKLPVEVEITHVRVGFPVEDADADTPFLRGGRWWMATIEIASGQIMKWSRAKHFAFHLFEKVTDQGSYELLAPDGRVVALLENKPVPHDLIPGGSVRADCIELKVNCYGEILNWSKYLTAEAFAAFFPAGDVVRGYP